MRVEKVPVTVEQLLATATQVTANVAKHRAAMAEVAAQARANVPAQPETGGETK